MFGLITTSSALCLPLETIKCLFSFTILEPDLDSPIDAEDFTFELIDVRDLLDGSGFEEGNGSSDPSSSFSSYNECEDEFLRDAIDSSDIRRAEVLVSLEISGCAGARIGIAPLAHESILGA